MNVTKEYGINLFGDIDDVIKRLQFIKNKCPNAESITVVKEWVTYHSYEEYIVETRPETKEEKHDRLLREEEKELNHDDLHPNI